MKTCYKQRLILFFVSILTVPLVSSVYALDYTIIQITDNSSYDDSGPQIDNGRLVWFGEDGNDHEIFLSDRRNITRLTDNDYDDAFPIIHNGQVAWLGRYGDENGNEIFFYDGENTIQLTDNGYDECSPQIHNGQIVWFARDEVDSEIFFYDGETTIQFTNNSYDDCYPDIHNGQIVWSAWDGNDYEIFLYDGEKTIQLTNNKYDELDMQIHNGQVTWSEKMEAYGASQIFLYDGINTIQLTNTEYPNSNHSPKIHNGQIAWTQWDDGNDLEIFFYDGENIIQLTDNSSNDQNLQIHNGQVTWTKSYGNDSEIFVYDGKRTIRLTNNEYGDYAPQIHNGQVTWFGWDGNDYEIFLAVPIITVSGAVQYENRTFNETGTGDPDATELKPVRFAKFEIVRAKDDTILATGHTEEDGKYTISLPSFYKDEIFLRCYAQQKRDGTPDEEYPEYNIVVKNKSGDEYFYDSSPKTVVKNTATIDLNIPSSSSRSGPFNIFDCLVAGTDRIKELGAEGPPLITVIWTKRVSHATGYKWDNDEIYLNGAAANPDEYDDCVILHEYGHFIMRKYSYSKSPGGNHDWGDTNQDIRLSWAEGWANYFSCMVRDSYLILNVCRSSQTNSYVASICNIENLQNNFGFDLEYLSKGQDTDIAVAAILMDIFDNPDSGDDDRLGLGWQGARYIWDVVDNYISSDMDCVLEDFYQGWFSQNGPYYQSEINEIFSSRCVFYSTPAFVRGPTFVKADGRGIPNGTGESLSSILEVTDNLTIGKINVFVDLSHTNKSDLLLSLTSPSGAKVILHKYTPPLGGQSHDIFAWYQTPFETIPYADLAKFRGKNSQGQWILNVTDRRANEHSGVLNRWKIEFAPNSPPVAVSIQPSEASSIAEEPIFFNTVYSDADGCQDIKQAQVLFNTSINRSKCLYGKYDTKTNKLYLRNDSNTAWLGGFAPGSNNTIENSYCRLDCSNTLVLKSETLLTIDWTVIAKSTFTGAKKSYLYVIDYCNDADGWKELGTWTINP